MSEINQHESYLSMARVKATESDCIRRRVGAVIVKGASILILASNGTPAACLPCNAGGCPRCHSESPSGEAYDACLCIHAEHRAIAEAARTGVSVEGATLYVTLRPCISCLNLCLHAGIGDIVYDETITFNPSVEEAYTSLIEQTGVRLRRVGCS